jgi:hypothetical protein
MLGAPRNEDSSAAVAKRMGANASAGGLAKLRHILLLPGAVVIRGGGEAIGAIGVSAAQTAINSQAIFFPLMVDHSATDCGASEFATAAGERDRHSALQSRDTWAMPPSAFTRMV